MSLIVGLIVAALLLFFLEIFVPGGILAVIGGICLLIASALAYEPWGFWGSMSIVAGGMVAGVFLFFLEIKIITKLPWTKQFIHSQSNESTTKEEGDDSLVGQKGIALTRMAPTGLIQIKNKNFEATSIGGLIKQNANLQVVRAEHLKLVVKEI